MKSKTDQEKIEFGDFQTPLVLAELICQRLKYFDLKPEIIIEPTCGQGSFIQACFKNFPNADKILGIDINESYIENIRNDPNFVHCSNLELLVDDFFSLNWQQLLKNYDNRNILFIGNPPWVTNSQQGLINGFNLPPKANLKNLRGLDALTGKSNFDISEWILIKIVEILQYQAGSLAFLCKTSVARKIINYIYNKNHRLSYSGIFNIDSKKYFNISTSACLLFCEFSQDTHNYDCQVFDNLINPTNSYRLGYRQGILIKEIETFESLKHLYSPKVQKLWHSGIKHDCSKILELTKTNNKIYNSLGEELKVEDTYLFPLLKGSDIANKRTDKTNRYLLVTQSFIGESTENIQTTAPQTWQYLQKHSVFFLRKEKVSSIKIIYLLPFLE
jgi:hypothetical protein